MAGGSLAERHDAHQRVRSARLAKSGPTDGRDDSLDVSREATWRAKLCIWRPRPWFRCEVSATLASVHAGHRSRPRIARRTDGEPAAKKVMGVLVLKCRKCNWVIAPEDPIITICCGSPSKFEKCEITWHARCAPMMVRQYVPETKGVFQLERRE